MIYRPGEIGIPLSLQLDDGAATLYPSAHVYRGAVLEASIPLAHVALGRYSGAWTPATSSDYVVVFIVYSDISRTIESPDYTRESENWRPITAVSPQIASDVWDELLAGHTVTGSAGATMALIEKILRNRLELEEGSTDNWVLYDDDSTTPLLKWSVTDKDGASIQIGSFNPARRTRGA